MGRRNRPKTPKANAPAVAETRWSLDVVQPERLGPPVHVDEAGRVRESTSESDPWQVRAFGTLRAPDSKAWGFVSSDDRLPPDVRQAGILALEALVSELWAKGES
jgi:hypothetical protein